MKRQYNDESVEECYKEILTKQTMRHVIKVRGRRLDKQYMIMEVLELLNKVIDESDPDNTIPQIFHAFQTASSLEQTISKLNNIKIADIFGKEWLDLPVNKKSLYPDKLVDLYPHIEDWSWLPVTGLIHDAGKILTLDGYPQWSVVGDTFPVGCEIDEEVVYSHYHRLNPEHGLYGKYGNYQKNCGFDQLYMSYSHDEYLASVLENKCELPCEAIYLIRYHSFYSWHTPVNKRAYTHLADEHDWKMLPLLKLFQKSDLYSKTNTLEVGGFIYKIDNDLDKDIYDLIYKYYSNMAKLWIPNRLNF